MKNSLIKRSFYLSFFLLLLSTAGCKMEQISPIYAELDELVDFRMNDDFCDLFLMGRIVDAKTNEPISDAEIRIDFLSIFSDEDGKYKIKVNAIPDLMDNDKVVGVFRDGYTFSTLSINFENYVDLNNCSKSRVTVELDFALTARQASITATAEGGSFRLIDSTVVTRLVNGIPQQNVNIDTVDINIPANAVEGNVEIIVTPLEDDQYLGVFGSDDLGFAAIKRLDFQPEGIQFFKPIEITFRTDKTIKEEDILALYSLNTAENPVSVTSPGSNQFVREDALVTFDPTSKKITAAITHFSVGVIGVENGIAFDNVTLGEIVPAIEMSSLFTDTIANCNCGNGFPYTRVADNDTRTQLELGFDGPITFESAQERILNIYNLLKTTLNLPTINSNSLEGEVFGSVVTAYFPSVLDDSVIELNGFVEQCDVENLQVNVETYTYTGEAFGNDFILMIPNRVERKINNQVCPITTNCHQGCN